MIVSHRACLFVAALPTVSSGVLTLFQRWCLSFLRSLRCFLSLFFVFVYVSHRALRVKNVSQHRPHQLS